MTADRRTDACKIVVTSVVDAPDLADIATDAVLAKPFRRASVTQMVDRLSAIGSRSES